jgi:L-lactate dehydrogenase complex protein LldE
MNPSTRAVQLMVTCLVDQFFPETGLAAVEVLERLDVRIDCPAGQTCCGQPAFNAGFSGDARAMARHTIDVFGDHDLPVVAPSGSCTDMVVHHYPVLLAGDAAYAGRAVALARRTFEFSQFIVDRLDVTDVGARAGGRLTYHPCCHGLRGLGIRDQPERLLAAVQGPERCTLAEAETCCGFGGLFSVKMADISGAMLKRKLDCIQECGASTVVVTDVSCLMHMAGGLRRLGSGIQVRHIADVLRQTESG